MLYKQNISILPKGQFSPLQEITIQGLIGSAVNITLFIASVLFVFSLLFGGLRLILSMGNKDKTDQAKRQVVGAFVGIAIVFSSWAVLSFISQFFGIDLLTFEIPTL